MDARMHARAELPVRAQCCWLICGHNSLPHDRIILSYFGGSASPQATALSAFCLVTIRRCVLACAGHVLDLSSAVALATHNS